jgi:hypothetical protein
MQASDDLDFEHLSCHDDSVYGLALRLGDPAANDWRSDLVLDIDHIVDWVPGEAGTRFRVAPATLVFHGVSDLRIDIDWGMHGWQVAPAPPAIDRIERERVAVEKQRVFLDRPYYLWRIAFAFPEGASIRFGAVDFTLTLRREPFLLDEQRIPSSLREGEG